MPICHVVFELGAPPLGAAGRWIEASAVIAGPASFDFEAHLFYRTPSDELSVRTVRAKVPSAFTASTMLALLLLCSVHPFTPTGEGMNVFVSGDTWLTDGALTRLMETDTRRKAGVDAVPRECLCELLSQLDAARRVVNVQYLD